MEKCTAKQIEEKRKQALEKLKSRKSQLTINNIVPPVPKKPEQMISVNFEIASETRFEVNFIGYSESLVSYFR